MSAPGINVQSWSNIDVTPARFNLAGGRYQLMVVGTGWGAVTLNAVAPDGTTLLPVTGAALSANGYVIFEIGAGALCELTVDTTTAIYATISQVPLAPAN